MSNQDDMEISENPKSPQFSQMAALLSDQEPDSPMSQPSTSSKPKAKQKPKKKNARMKANKKANVDRRSKTIGALTARIEKPAWRVQPWADWNEWLQMKTLLTNNDHCAARNLLHIFTLRKRSNVPIAMTTSVALVSLLNQTEASDPYSRRLSLSMAITRFINGMTDILQPRDINRQAISVSIIADRLRLPPMLVEIRHQASHNQLPALNILEEGARQALLWLDGHYWQAQHDNLRRLDLFSEFGAPPCKQAFAHQSYTQLRADEQARVGNIPRKISAIQNFLNDSGNKDFGGSTLERLGKCIREWSGRRSQRVDRFMQPKFDADSHGGSLWTECGDNKEWKRTPIGLIPGQKFVPRISHASLGGRVPDVSKLDDEGVENCSDASFDGGSAVCGSCNEEIVDEGVQAVAENDGRSEEVQRPLENLRLFDEGFEKRINEEVKKFDSLFKSILSPGGTGVLAGETE